MTDLGCGDGRLDIAIAQVANIEKMVLCDISQKFINTLRNGWVGPCVLETYVQDIRIARPTDNNDVIMFGVLPYIFDDGDVVQIMNRHRHIRMLVRTPCQVAKRGVIDKMSVELGGDRYAAVYRTHDEVMCLLSVHHRIVGADLCWPVELDSQFGTRQWVFELEPKEIAHGTRS